MAPKVDLNAPFAGRLATGNPLLTLAPIAEHIHAYSHDTFTRNILSFYMGISL